MSAGRATPSLKQATITALDAYVKAPRLPEYKRPITDRRGLKSRLTALQGSLGPKGAAQAAGVTARTWRTWIAGKQPRPSSLRAIERAYQDDLDRRSQTPERRKAQARRQAKDGVTVGLLVWAEIQYDGYYNAQADSVGAEQEAPPFKDNRSAWRHLTCGPTDIGPLLRAWANGRLTAPMIERLIRDRLDGSSIFANTYYRGARVDLT